ncbi:EAL domain-containing protein [Aeromonas bivalvium]|uniref:EAL domain-containing protein n=1 Tax=Aeromonas bivalvium TaxID=440079 RepID=UPI0038D09700
MLAFKKEYPLSAMARVAVADVAVPFYQPIIGRDRRVRGYEALARRWDAVTQSYQGIDFASLDQDESLHLDILMLRAIMGDLPALAKGGPYALSINLNPAIFSPTYQTLLLRILAQARQLGITIWFEVLEHARLESRYRALIEELRAHGAHIACDDFGSLACNFQRLMALPYDIVKLDRSLLLQAARTPHACKMLTGLVAYLQRLGMAVVCEGVETQTHVELANGLGCDYQQGYAYARPSPLSRWC